MLSTGFSIDVHYCMGAMAGISISHDGDEDGACPRCGMKENKTGCCRDEIKFYKFDKGFKSSKSVSVNHHFSDVIYTDFIFYSLSVPKFFTYIVSLYRAPNIEGPPIYLRNRVFRI